jgi:DNA polymerase type B, organellar and viral
MEREPSVWAWEAPERSRAARGVRRAHRSIEVGTIDSETDGFHHCTDANCPKCGGKGRVPKPFLWGLYLGERDEYLEFETEDEVIAYLRDQKIILYAHNGGKFDYHYLRDYINTDQPLMVINGRLAKFKIGECEFRDSLNIFPNTRLADFGVKNEIDYELMEPEKRNDPNIRPVISAYLKQDCVGLYEQVARYRKEYGKSLTQAGASMKYWEKHHYQMDAPRQTKTQFERYQPYYYGGRVQCFESGVLATQFKVADINSAYPRAMLEEHPISTSAVASHRLPTDEKQLHTCLINLECTARGCFPWREKREGHGEGCVCDQCRKGELFFPVDEGGHRNRTRVYTVTGWEYIAALEHNAISNIKIREVHRFPQTISFKDYIEHHYHARMEADARGDKAGKIFGKYFMNSLYGKFGSNCENYSEYVIATEDSIQGWRDKGYIEYQDWGHGKFLMERPPREEDLEDITSRWRYYNVSTSASITGFVRAYLFASISKASGVIYCDTDSIAAREVANLEFGKELGKWKDEGTFDHFSIAGKKLYAFHYAGRPETYDPKEEKTPSWKIASKGVNFGAMSDGPKLITELAEKKAIKFYPQVPTYSLTRTEPMFINREIRSTARDMSQAPLPQKIIRPALAARVVQF